MPHDNKATNTTDDGSMVDSSGFTGSPQGVSQQHQRSRRLVTQPKTGVVKYNVSDDTIEFTDSVYQILGFDEEEIDLSTRMFLSSIHPDDTDQAQELISEGQLHAPGQVQVRIIQPEDPTYMPSTPSSYSTYESWMDGCPDDVIRTVDLNTFNINSDGNENESVNLTISDVTPTHSRIPRDVIGSDKPSDTSTFAGTPSHDLFEKITSGGNVGFFRVDVSDCSFLSVNEFMGDIVGCPHEQLIGNSPMEYLSNDINGDELVTQVNESGHTSKELEVTTVDGDNKNVYLEASTHTIHGRSVIDGVLFCPSKMNKKYVTEEAGVPENVSLLEHSFSQHFDSVSGPTDGETTPEQDPTADPNTRLQALVQSDSCPENISTLTSWLEEARDHPTIIDVRLNSEADYEIIIEIECEVVPTKLISEITNFAPYPNRRVLTTQRDGVFIERIALSRDFVKPSDLDL